MQNQNHQRSHNNEIYRPPNTNPKEIRFFGIRGKYGILSNFSPTPLTINGLHYPTVEHYFQSMKFVDTDPEHAENVRLAETPLISKKLGKSRDHPLVPGWTGESRQRGQGPTDGGLSVVVMRRALLNKAFQNEDFRKTLMAIPKDARIIEASPFDYFWGEGKEKTGRNMLGVLLMELRDLLVKREKDMYQG